MSSILASKMKVPVWWRTIGRAITNLPDTVEGGKTYAAFVKAWSLAVNYRSAQRFAKKIVPILPDSIQKALASRSKLPYFFASDSAKVRHSAQHSIAKPEQWMNAVLYLAPADMAAPSFGIIAPELIDPLIENLSMAAKHDSRWSGFAPVNGKRLDAFQKSIRSMVSTGKLPETSLSLDNSVRPLSLCPYSSPICRNVCLNTTGHAGFGEKKLTESDAHFLAWLEGGKSGNYCGAPNEALASRIARTHAMWAIWAVEGVIRNSFNDHVFEEIRDFAEVCNHHGIHLAVRFNGTSDIPVETLELTSGKNLVEEAAKLGVVMYDYTKDYKRMMSWVKARAWRQKRGKGGWSPNYWLSYSWSEMGLLKAGKVLQAGGNVVVVFRRAKEVKRSEEQIIGGREMKKYRQTVAAGKTPKEYARIQSVKLTLSELTGGRISSPGYLDVVNGDDTDLRFNDPWNAPKGKMGVVVGLAAKGRAEKPYGIKEHQKVMKGVQGHFVVPLEITGGVAKVRTNPPKVAKTGGEENALQVVDATLAKELAVQIPGGLILGTTAEGT